MSFDIVNFALASNVADAGTVTVGYPTGRSKGNYSRNTNKHKLSVNGNLYSCPADFTVTFNANASSITVTNASGVTWPQGAVCGIQLEREGVNDGALLSSVANVNRMQECRVFILDLGSPNILDADGIAASQSVTVGTTPLAVLNGALASSGTVTLDVPRNVVAAWTGTAILTVTGKDEYDNTIVEKSGSGTSLTGKKAFKKITSCSFSANVTSATIGTGDVLGLPVAINSSSQILAELQDGLRVGGPTTKTRVNWFAEQVSVLAGTTAAIELIAPIAGNISGLTVVTRAAVTTGGNVTVKIGTTDVTGLTVAVANSSTKGTTTSDTPTTPGDSSTLVAKGDRIQIVFDDAFNTAGALDGYIEITPADAVTDGTLVKAVTSEATATTGDVRGTYDPNVACDGTTGFKLLVALADPADIGVAQYAG